MLLIIIEFRDNLCSFNRTKLSIL